MAPLKMLLLILILLASYLLFHWVSGTVLRDRWPIELVSVEGQLDRGEKKQIQDAVAHHVRDGIFMVNLDDVVLSVMALSWPREVTVRRGWPNKLMLNVRKHSLVAHWNDSGYLSASGQVVFDPDLPAESLPSLSAKHSDGIRAMNIYKGLSKSLQDTQLKLKTLQEDELGGWKIGFQDGLTVILGSREITARFERFVRVYKLSIHGQAKKVIQVDARYPNGVAVKWLDDEQHGESIILASNKLNTGEHL